MYAKTTAFEAEAQALAQVGKVFSHPARLAIIKFLAERQDCIVGDIAQEFSFLSRTTLITTLKISNVFVYASIFQRLKNPLSSVKSALSACLFHKLVMSLSNYKSALAGTEASRYHTRRNRRRKDMLLFGYVAPCLPAGLI
jgi:DNA-binding transcriptional ArsR family regulator